MKSVKTKVIVLVCTFTIASSLIIGAFSIINSRKVVDADSEKILNLLCENKVNNINTLLYSIQNSVDTLTKYAQSQMDDYDKLKSDKTYLKQYINSLVDVSINAAGNTSGATTVYIRINPEFAGGTSGFFYERKNQEGPFVSLPPTDLLGYDKDNIERVGWYYQPVNNKEATWINPYMNRNIDTEIISYVIPYYYHDQLIGVVGMDIDFKIIQEIVSETNTYQTGYAFLVDNNSTILYHKNIKPGTNLITYNNGEFKDMADIIKIEDSQYIPKELVEYVYGGTEKKATFRILENDMRFILTVPSSEVDSQANSLLLQICTTMFVIVTIAIILTFIFSRRLVKPLLELTEASKKIASGDLNVKIEHKSHDELGILAESFQQTIIHLERYFSSIKSLAYQDSLTGIKNKTAYLEKVIEIDEDIKQKKAQFAIIVFDINGLKLVNDSYGHSAGDLLIINSCKIFSKVFIKHSIYRIGGDEFVVIIQNISEEECYQLIHKFNNEIGTFNNSSLSQHKISIAHGLAIFNPSNDKYFKDVFERADKNMYLDKNHTKTSKPK